MDQEGEIKLIFLGDISLNGRYIEMYKESQNPFVLLEKKMSKADIIIGNLESFAKGDDSENHLKKPRLTTTIQTLNYLKNINLDIVCLANNHVYDHLESGFNKTIQFLDQNKIQHLGSSNSEDEASTPVIIEKGDVKIGILNYVTHDTNPKIPYGADIKLNYFQRHKAIIDIQSLKDKVDHIVLSLHWGGRVEGGLFPDYYQPKIAKELIDAGADLIVGHHSHTVQPYEKYKGKYIFYSLGNFCFSDYWFENKYYPLQERRRMTSILMIDFKKTDYKVEISFYKNEIKRFSVFKKYPINWLNFIHKNLFCYKIIWNVYYLNLRSILPLVLFLKRKDISGSDKIKRIVKAILKRMKSI